MIETILHFRGFGHESRALPALPAVGDFVHGPGKATWLWRVDSIRFDGEAVRVFVAGISKSLADELAAAWNAWDEGQPVEADAPTDA